MSVNDTLVSISYLFSNPSFPWEPPPSPFSSASHIVTRYACTAAVAYAPFKNMAHMLNSVLNVMLDIWCSLLVVKQVLSSIIRQQLLYLAILPCQSSHLLDEGPPPASSKKILNHMTLVASIMWNTKA